MVAIRRPGGEIVRFPFEVKHDIPSLTNLVKILNQIGGDIRIVMEHTGIYWYPIARRLASMLPEYPIVMELFGVGPVTGPQLISEIGDVRRFTSKRALVAFAGGDAPPFQSGSFDSKSRHISKRGTPLLRKTAFLVCSVILQSCNVNDPIYAFMDKKRSEGKHYYIYMVAGAAKFLRIYYARVKEHLNSINLIIS